MTMNPVSKAVLPRTKETQMPTYLHRYRAGEHEQVWRELRALGGAVRTAPLLSDATDVARETAVRARHNIDMLIPRLEHIGYQFGFYEKGDPVPHYTGPIIPPAANIGAQLDTLEAMTGPLPLALRAWYEIVGAVDFMGYHPEWRSHPDWKRRHARPANRLLGKGVKAGAAL